MAPITTNTSSGALLSTYRHTSKVAKLRSSIRRQHRAFAKIEHNRLVATLLSTTPDRISTTQQWNTYLTSHPHTKALRTCAYQTSTFGAEFTVSRWWDGNHSLWTEGLLADATTSKVPSMQSVVRRCTKIYIRLMLAGLKPLNRFHESEDVALIEKTVRMALRPVERLVQKCRRAEEVTVEVNGKDGVTTSIAAEMIGDLWANEDPRVTITRVRTQEIPPVCAGHFGRRVRRIDGEGSAHRVLQVSERGETESEKSIRKWLDGVEHDVVVIEDDEVEVAVKVEQVEESEVEEHDEEEYEQEEYVQEEYEEPRPGMMISGVYYVRKGGELMVM